MAPPETLAGLPNPAEIRRRLAKAGGLPPAAETRETDNPADGCLWGVAESITGRPWRLRDSDPAQVQALSAALGVPDLVARLLHQWGLSPADGAGYLNPTLKDLLPDPDSLTDMAKAVTRIARAVERGERICVFADYDVDGATSAALMLRLLRALGADACHYVPDRIVEGYGPSAQAFAELAGQGMQLIITVDCGIAAAEALGAAADLGVEVVVIDHHLPGDALPPAAAIVNPNREDDTSGLGMLAAVGVTFMVCVGLMRHLRGLGWFETQGRPAPDLRQWLDLVALGTVCDVVPLTGLNRAFVVQGIKVMAGSLDPDRVQVFPGLRALARVAGLSERPGPYHLGFILGPRINAGGRVGRADLGTCLLTTEDPGDAQALAEDLDTLNGHRRDVEAAVLAQAVAQGDAALEAWPERPILIVRGEGWHPGVIGIVAGRLKDRFERPVLALAIEGGEAKGSARSVPGVDLGAAVIAAREAGLLVKGGGHAMAAGLTVAQDGIEALDTMLCEYLTSDVARARADLSLWVDATCSLAGASRDLYDAMDRAGPFGAGAPEPVVAIREARIDWVQIVGEAHIRLTLTSPEGAKLTAMAFRAMGTPLGDWLLSGADRNIHAVGYLRADNYKGRNGVQMHLLDVSPV